jgi:hypothetical protein
MTNPGEARNNKELRSILAKPGIIENHAQSWRSQDNKEIIPNPGEARNNKESCPILAKPGIIENYAQSWRSHE